MMATIILILGIFMFVGLVVVHELGHFLVARRNGVEVEEFGIGFPPRLWSRKTKSGYVFSINWLPLGGFVKLKGEHDSDTQKGSYGAANLWVKTKILLAGVTMNLIAAAVILTVLAAISMPKADLKSLPFYDREQFSIKSDTKIVQNKVFVAVVEDSPASRAGLRDGDQITAINEEEVSGAESLPELTKKYSGQVVNISYFRGSQQQNVNATLNSERTENVGYLGVAPFNSQTFRATWSAPIVGAVTALQYTEVSFRGLGYVLQNLFIGQGGVAGEAVGGPVATFKILSDTAATGILQVLFVIALISISLAVMNTLPIPALDGGRLFVTLLYRISRRRLTKKAEEWIHGTGFAFLMLLIVLITVIDVKRFF